MGDDEARATIKALEERVNAIEKAILERLTDIEKRLTKAERERPRYLPLSDRRL